MGVFIIQNTSDEINLKFQGFAFKFNSISGTVSKYGVYNRFVLYSSVLKFLYYQRPQFPILNIARNILTRCNQEKKVQVLNQDYHSLGRYKRRNLNISTLCL